MLAQVEPGELRARAARRAARGAGAVRGRPARPRRRPPAGAHALAEPALLRLLRDHRLGARRSSPSCSARGLNQVGILWRTSPALQELEEVTLDWLAQLLGLPAGLHGHIEDTASTATMVGARGRARSAKPGARVVVCSEHAHSSVEKACRLLELEVRPAPVDDAFRLRAGRARPRRTPAPSSRRSGRPRRARRPGAGDRRRLRGAPASGCTSTRPTRARRRSARSCAGTSPAGSGPTRSSSTRTSGCLTPMDCSTLWTRRPDDLRARLQPRAGVPARQRGGGEPLASTARCSAAASARSSSGRCSAATAARACRSGSARRSASRRCSRAGCATSRAGRCRAAAVLARLLPPRRLRRGERGAARARQRDAARSSSRTRG